jgi:hypothetical protein
MNMHVPMPSAAYTKGVTNTRRSRALAAIVRRWAQRYIAQRPQPHVVIGEPGNPYLLRWFVIPRNPLFNIYLHKMLRDDEDRALHDHPWWSISLNLGGTLGEIYQASDFEIHRWFQFGDVVRRGPTFAHRLLVPHGDAMTLFITGPKIRAWGFHCDPPVGWRHWREFTAPTAHYKSGGIGKGCNP